MMECSEAMQKLSFFPRADKYDKYRKSLNYIKYINFSYIIKYLIYSLDLKESLTTIVYASGAVETIVS
jgi:hypothetical protein